ncbi:hypothetical protein DAEQUDRAFT_100877 [Daedalea quercina L-15889]|uniref:Uncharacterized protein n=1 Tax=Daedalea quercina L-15889 TaxID=1314783 RepID=A0A165KWV3_9APHY|nr:hypothetical protein DAEQUDRAFT_100877 [Daedalea quercina L-15889]
MPRGSEHAHGRLYSDAFTFLPPPILSFPAASRRLCSPGTPPSTPPVTSIAIKALPVALKMSANVFARMRSTMHIQSTHRAAMASSRMPQRHTWGSMVDARGMERVVGGERPVRQGTLPAVSPSPLLGRPPHIPPSIRHRPAPPHRITGHPNLHLRSPVRRTRRRRAAARQRRPRWTTPQWRWLYQATVGASTAMRAQQVNSHRANAAPE